jgi:hypothetical protein
MDGLTGRWLVRDPIREAGSINLYGYVGANPVRYFDAKGSQAAELMENDAWQRVCQVICVNDLGFVVGVELGLMLVQSSVTLSSWLWECGNPAFVAGFPSAVGAVEKSG